MSNPLFKQKDPKIIIGMLLPDKSKCFLENTKQKHLIVTYCINFKGYIGIGMLTSQQVENVTYTFSNQKFKDFQKEHFSGVVSTDAIGPNNKKLPQMFRPFTHAELIPEDKIIKVKGGEAYLQKAISKDILNIWYNKLSQMPAIEYDSQGHTKQDFLNICKEYDYRVKKGEAHPEHSDKKITDKSNQEKMKSTNVK